MRHSLQRRGDLSRKGRQGFALSGHHGRVAVRVSREREVRFLEQDCFLVLYELPIRLKQALSLGGHMKLHDFYQDLIIGHYGAN